MMRWNDQGQVLAGNAVFRGLSLATLNLEPAAELLLLNDLIFLKGDRFAGDNAGNDDSDANIPFFLGVLLFGVFTDAAGREALSFSALFDSKWIRSLCSLFALLSSFCEWSRSKCGQEEVGREGE